MGVSALSSEDWVGRQRRGQGPAAEHLLCAGRFCAFPSPYWMGEGPLTQGPATTRSGPGSVCPVLCLASPVHTRGEKAIQRAGWEGEGKVCRVQSSGCWGRAPEGG